MVNTAHNILYHRVESDFWEALQRLTDRGKDKMASIFQTTFQIDFRQCQLHYLESNFNVIYFQESNLHKL